MAAGVSVGTVSNVLNSPDRVAPATVSRVQAAIDQLGFVRNDAARQLRAGHSRTIGLVVLEAANPFFADIARGAEERAREAGLVILLANSDDDADRQRTNLDLFLEQRVAGVLVSPVGADLSQIERASQRGANVILLERDGTDLGLPSVAVDNVAGGRLAAEHLVDIGRRRIAFVGGPATLHQVADRLEGARLAADGGDASIEAIPTSSLTVPAGRAAGRELAARRPNERPDAVFAANDLVAIGVLQSLRQAGLATPDDVAIVGYDDIDFAAVTEVPLTSIRQPSRQLGATAVQLLLERVANPASPARHQRFDPELVIRATSGAPPPAR